MIFYITDNEVSHTVGAAFEKGGATIAHINNFEGGHQWPVKHRRPLYFEASQNDIPIFYGILRGAGSAVRICNYLKEDFYYVDNGYFDAVYMNHQKHKVMTGTYRVVKNDLIHKYTGCPVRTEARRPLKILALPPTPYSANMQDTTPEDWFEQLKKLRAVTKDHVDVRLKDEKRPLNDQLQEYDGVVSFNSMSVMAASKLGKAVWDFHGIFRNADKFATEIPYFDYESLRDFYSTKQFTLDEIAEGNWE